MKHSPSDRRKVAGSRTAQNARGMRVGRAAASRGGGGLQSRERALEARYAALYAISDDGWHPRMLRPSFRLLFQNQNNKTNLQPTRMGKL